LRVIKKKEERCPDLGTADGQGLLLPTAFIGSVGTEIWSPQTLVPEFREGLVFKAHRRLYHSSLGLRVIKKKKKHRNLVPPNPHPGVPKRARI